MKLWGLTGGIASGKSTIAAMFAARGVDVLNADSTYHALLAPHAGEPSPLARAVATAFAELPLLRADATVDRAILGAKVFADVAARERLEQIVHPAVRAATQSALRALQAQGAPQAIYDVPLLYEKELQGGFDGVVVVWVPQDLQLQRLQARDGLSPKAAAQRLRAQMPLDQKRALGRWVIDNSRSLESSDRAVAEVHRQMLAAVVNAAGQA